MNYRQKCLLSLLLALWKDANAKPTPARPGQNQTENNGDQSRWWFPHAVENHQPAVDFNVFYCRFDKSRTLTSNNHPSPPLPSPPLRIWGRVGSLRTEEQESSRPRRCVTLLYVKPTADSHQRHVKSSRASNNKHPSSLRIPAPQALTPLSFFYRFHTKQQRSFLFYILLLLRLWNNTTGVDVTSRSYGGWEG